MEILKFDPCSEALRFRKKFNSFQEAWENCPRGDWMLWIASKLKVDIKKLTIAKALCANTVRHLMVDIRSTDAIDAALLFGKGKISKKELKAKYIDAAAAAYDAAAYDAAAYAAVAAANAAAAAYAAVAAANAAAAAATNATNAEVQNQLKTANICREILTDEILNLI